MSSLDVAGITFNTPLTAYSTDRIELDFKDSRAILVNSAGKIKTSTRFKSVEVPTENTNGTSATAGSR